MAMSGTKPHKYRAVRTEYDGVWYDSGIEARRAAELDILMSADRVMGWSGQVRVPLGEDTVAVVDFLVWQRRGRWYEEVKGFETPDFRRIRRLWKRHGPLPLLIYKMKNGRWQIETLPAASQERADG